jgi:hypothetical protein
MLKSAESEELPANMYCPTAVTLCVGKDEKSLVPIGV